MIIQTKKIVDTLGQSSKTRVKFVLNSINISQDFKTIIFSYTGVNPSNSKILEDQIILTEDQIDETYRNTLSMIEKGNDYHIKLQLEMYSMFIYMICQKYKINLDDVEVVDTENFTYE